MFAFFKRLISRRKRNLFKFWDGSRMRSDDPLAIQMRIETHPTCRWDVHPVAAERGDVESYKITIQAICDVFQVQMFEPDSQSGLTQVELMQLLSQYSDYVYALKKNIGPLPIWRAASDATSEASSNTTTSDSQASTTT
jgi:hypothetical protein